MEVLVHDVKGPYARICPTWKWAAPKFGSLSRLLTVPLHVPDVVRQVIPRISQAYRCLVSRYGLTLPSIIMPR